MESIINKKKRYKDNGKYYYFNNIEFNDRFEKCRQLGLKKKDLSKDIANLFTGSPGSLDTIDGWRSGETSPQNLTLVKKIAKYFNTDYMNFLIPVDPEDKNTMNTTITDETKDVAKNIYCELCELIDSLDWPGDPGDWEYKLEYTSPHLEKLHLKNHEDYRHYLKMLIRKASFDLSKEFRKTLEAFVDECIGPFNEEYPSYQYFFAGNYDDYLNENVLTDNVLPRHIYSVNHTVNMFKKLDEIFKDYICD